MIKGANHKKPMAILRLFQKKVSGSNNKERLLHEFHDKFLMSKNKTNASAMALVVLARVVPLVIMYE